MEVTGFWFFRAATSSLSLSISDAACLSASTRRRLSWKKLWILKQNIDLIWFEHVIFIVQSTPRIGHKFKNLDALSLKMTENPRKFVTYMKYLQRNAFVT